MGRDAALSAVQSMGLRRASALAARRLGERPTRRGELASWQREALAALLERMCRGDDQALPAPGEIGALKAALEFAARMPEVTHQQLLDLLAVFEAGTYLLGPDRSERFSRLSAPAQDRYIALWETSRIEAQRAAFHGLKSVCMIGYWTREATWPHLGYGLDTELEPGLNEEQR